MTEYEITQLSETIKLQRFRKRKSQENCAKALNVSIPTYREFEYNPNKLSLEQALKLSIFLEFNMFEIFLSNILQNVI